MMRNTARAVLVLWSSLCFAPLVQAEEESRNPFVGEVEIGYAYGSAHWGQGIATEAAFAVIRFGFETVGLARIIGVADPTNVASRRVLGRIGMRYVGEVRYFDMDLSKYVLDHAEFQPPDALYHLHTDRN